MSLLPGDKAPWFGAKCYHTNDFVDLCLDDLTGGWILLFFYPMDFDHIAVSELMELERFRPRLERNGCRIVAVSRDGVLAHEQFARLAPVNGGVAGIRFPLMEDLAGKIGRAYGMLMPEGGITYRGCFIINPAGIVKGQIISDLPVGLDIKEVARQVRKLVTNEEKYTVEHPTSVEHSVEERIFVAGEGSGFFNNPAAFYVTHVLRKAEFPVYTLGQRQSPISLSSKAATMDPSLGPISFLYDPQPAGGPPKQPMDGPVSAASATVVQNTGSYWEVCVPEALQGHLLIRGGPLGAAEYRLVSLRAHWGRSEHSLEGQHTAAELQLLHINTKYPHLAAASVREDGLAVVAVLLERRTDGTGNKELEKIRHLLPLIQEKGRSTKLSTGLDYGQLLPASPYYYTYPGSKTEPDFTENVIWIVMEEPMGVSSGALAAMKELSYGGAADPRMRVNARPPVPQSGDRPVRRWRRE